MKRSSKELQLRVHVTFSYRCADIAFISSSSAAVFDEDTSIKTMGEIYILKFRQHKLNKTQKKHQNVSVTHAVS